jgi:3-deoxy-D-manno-octulosonic-acid transferase
LTYPFVIRIAAPFHPKAKAWVVGRAGIFQQLEKLRGQGPTIWIHCASLGEFEQGRPVIEHLKSQYPNYKILLTFFSPSGYENQKHFPGADWVFYLPMDSPSNAKRFLDVVNPTLAIFVKYEFWFYYLKKLHYRKVPLLLISASFRPEMSFFRWYGAFARKMLTRFDRIFVQDETSKELLSTIGITKTVEVAGDTRFDRVVAIAAQTRSIPEIDAFMNGKPTIIIGSSWQADEQLWQRVWPRIKSLGIKLLIAPHEVNGSHILQLQKLFPEAVLHSALSISKIEPEPAVLIVDRIGLLAHLYRFGWVNYVGGGMTPAGVHNVLEAAVYGRPVICGPHIKKYREAVELVDAGGSVALPASQTSDRLLELLEEWISNPNQISAFGTKAANYVNERTGSVNKIIHYIQENRLLTS